MTEQISKIKIGAFVLAGVALLLVSIIMVGGDRKFLHSYTTYKIHFHSTEGLAAGSVVSLSGMDVGNVSKIGFADDSTMVVYVNILSDVRRRITDSSVATIRTQGALGDKYVYITPGLTSEKMLAPNSIIKSVEQKDLLEMLTTGKGPDLSVALQTVHDFNEVLNSLNENNRLITLLDNFSKAGSSVSQLADEPNIRESFAHLKSILEKIDDGKGTLGRLVNDPTLHDRLLSLLGDEPRNRYLKPLLREAIRQNEQARDQSH